MFDAYTVKKVLPRLFIAVILIQLSWFLFTGLINIMNAVAYGVEGLIYAPFGGVGELDFAKVLWSDVDGGRGLFVALSSGLLVGGLVTAIAVGGIVTSGIMVIMGVFIAFALLLFRQIIIVALLIISPLALVAWILPGTEKYWKLWWDSFFKLLLVYPIILGMLAIGRVMAYVVADVDPSSAAIGNIGADALFSGIDDLVIFFLVLACLFGPFYLIPKTFQMAGGVFQTLTGTINNKSKGAFDRLRNRRKQTMARNWDASKAGNRFKGDNWLSRRASRAVQTGTLMGTRGVGFNRAAIRSARSDRMSEAMAKGKENAAVQSVMSNDDLLNAAVHGNMNEQSAREYLSQNLGQSGAELEQNVASIMRAKHAMGHQNFNALAAVANAGTGTGYGNGPADMLQAINHVAGNDRALAARMLAEARGQATNARRFDLGGAGFSTSARMMQEMYESNGHGAAAVQAAYNATNDTMTDEVLRVQGAGAVAGGRNRSIQNLAPAIQRRLDHAQQEMITAQQSGDQAEILRTHREFKQALASTAGLLDVAAQVSPENAQVLADQVMAYGLTDPSTNTTITVGQHIEGDAQMGITGYRNDVEFGQMRREQRSLALSQANQINANAIAGAQQGGGPQVIPPIPGQQS